MDLLSPLLRVSVCSWRVGGLRDISMLVVDCIGTNLNCGSTERAICFRKIKQISAKTSFRDTQHLSPILSGQLPLMPILTT